MVLGARGLYRLCVVYKLGKDYGVVRIYLDTIVLSCSSVLAGLLPIHETPRVFPQLVHLLLGRRRLLHLSAFIIDVEVAPTLCMHVCRSLQQVLSAGFRGDRHDRTEELHRKPSVERHALGQQRCGDDSRVGVNVCSSLGSVTLGERLKHAVAHAQTMLGCRRDSVIARLSQVEI